MKSTSTASVLALSGMLLGLPMVEGRGGKMPQITLTGETPGFHMRPVAQSTPSSVIDALRAPPNTDTDMTKSEEANVAEKPPLFAAPLKPEEISGGGTVNGLSKADVLARAGESTLAEEESVAREEETRAGGFPGLDLDLLRNNDNPGNGGQPDAAGDNPGNGGQPDAAGGDPDETDPLDMEKDIPFYCDLNIDFFEDKGREPTRDEVKELISMTDNWLSEVFEIDPTFVFISEEETNSVYDPDAKDSFYLEFSSVAHANHAESDFWELNIDDISAMVNHADYEVYITHFIWEGEPQDMEDFQFYQTQQVTLGCWRGERPSATERRRLRGSAIAEPAFGGSHKVARH